jgi:isochorismate synthase
MTQVWQASSARESSLGSLELLRRKIESARAEAAAAPDEIVLLSLEAPVVSVEGFLQRFPELDAVSWHPADGSYVAGLGVAHSITGRGPGRFRDVLDQGARLWRRVRAPGGTRAAVDVPRLLGGFAFADEGAAQAPWTEFGPARFVLPRVTYAGNTERASLTLAVERTELERGVEGPGAELLRRAHEALLDDPRPLPSRAAEPLEHHEPDAAAFERRVEALTRLIAAGEFEKVVTAREVQLSSKQALDAISTLAALRDQAGGCERFLFRWGDSAFIGATPERLLSKRGLTLETEALAGSIDAKSESPEFHLRASSKELEEHRLVVASIERALEPVCGKVQAQSAPMIRHLKHIMHLCTPIRARLERETHVLDVVERLHPTPAVGGVPTASATAWISRHEGFDRGWYSGAVGWFDAAGDGDFNVALRSGLLRSKRAWLYAGAGIVNGSMARAEFAETTLKLSAVRTSLRTRL